jgi:uncharacterized protein
MTKPVPYITAESTKYWEACRDGKLLYQHCSECGLNQFYPRFHCKKCGSKNMDYRESRGIGTISTYTNVYRAPSPEFKEDVPYVLALIDLDEGFRMMSNIVGRNEGINIGDKVIVTFEKRSEEIFLPQFQKLLTFNELKVGTIYGKEIFECSHEKVQQWEEIYSDDVIKTKNSIVPAGMCGVIIMNTYDVTLSGRPPGNVHGSQNFKYFRPIQVGEVVITTLSVDDKFIKNDRKWVIIKTETTSENGELLLEGSMRILWAE